MWRWAWARASVVALCAVLASSQSSNETNGTNETNETELACFDSWVDASADGLGCLHLDHAARTGWYDAQTICAGSGGKLLE